MLGSDDNRGWEVYVKWRKAILKACDCVLPFHETLSGARSASALMRS